MNRVEGWLYQKDRDDRTESVEIRALVYGPGAPTPREAPHHSAPNLGGTHKGQGPVERGYTVETTISLPFRQQ